MELLGFLCLSKLRWNFFWQNFASLQALWGTRSGWEKDGLATLLRILNELSRIDQSAVNIVVNTGFPLAEAETPRTEVQGREPPPKLEITTVDFVERLWKSVSTENVFGPSGRKVSKTRFYCINYKIWELSKKILSSSGSGDCVNHTQLIRSIL